MRRIDSRASYNSEVVNSLDEKSWEQAEADTADRALQQVQQDPYAWRQRPKTQSSVQEALNRAPDTTMEQQQPQRGGGVQEARGAPSGHP